jgi:PAS domain S-box-containing protein
MPDADAAPTTMHGTIAADRHGCVSLWDQGAVDLIGYRPDEIVGRSVEAIVPPEFREQHRRGFERAMSGGARSADAAPFYLPVLLADQAIRLFAARFVFLDDPYGGALGAMILVQPTAERAEAFTPVPQHRARLAPQ